MTHTDDDLRVAKMLGCSDDLIEAWKSHTPTHRRYISQPNPGTEAQCLEFVQGLSPAMQLAFGARCFDVWCSRNPPGGLSDLWLPYRCGDYARAALAATAGEDGGG